MWDLLEDVREKVGGYTDEVNITTCFITFEESLGIDGERTLMGDRS